MQVYCYSNAAIKRNKDGSEELNTTTGIFEDRNDRLAKDQAKSICLGSYPRELGFRCHLSTILNITQYVRQYDD